MYGAFSYGSIPYGDGGGVEPFDADAMLSASREELVYTVELDVWDLGDELIDRTTGTNIGNLTGNAGLGAAFDGATSQGVGASAARGGNTGYVGKTLAVPSAIDRVVVHGSNNFGYAFATNAATTIDLYGKVGAAPASATDGTLIGSIAFTDTSNESVGREIDCTDKSVMYDHVWVVITSSGEGTAVYCAELVIYRSRASTIRLGSAEWATAPTDVPSSAPFDGRLTTVLQWSRSIVGDRIGASFQSGEGTVAFLNADGAYDEIVDGYSIDGRDVVVRVGRKTDPFANHHVVFRGVGVDWSADTDTVTVTVRDRSFLLDDPAQPNVYAGTGGAEGSADVADKRKPRVYGTVRGCPMLMINSSLLIYQVSDEPVASIFNVYDRGVALNLGADYADYAALAAAVVTPGDYATSIAAGMVKLGASPDGILFCQPSRDSIADQSTADVIKTFLFSSLEFTDDDLDGGSFDTVDVAQGNPIDFFIDPSESLSAAEMVDRLMSGLRGGWAAFNREGKLAIGTVGVFSGTALTGLSSATVAAYFDRDEGDIIDLRREALPSGIWPPPWRIRVAEDRAWTVFDDFAGAVDAGTRLFYSQPYRLLSAEDTSVLDAHRSAQDPPPVEAYWSDGAASEAARMLALWTAGYRLYRIIVSRRALGLDLGDKINVRWPRFGLSAGKDMIVVGLDDRIDISDGSPVDQVEVLAYG